MKADRKFSKYSRPLVASLLLSGGMLQLAAPVLAQGTAAGTQITNTATASYEDPTDPTKPLNTFSNTVKVEVAEVAGITVVADTFKVVDGTTLAATNTGAVAGNKVYFDYTVTNVGNDPTQLRIPGTATSTGASSVDKVQYSLDGGTTWIDIDPAGDYTSPSKAPGDSVKVRVIASILTGATANSPVTVTLGHTGTPNDQNTDRAADTTGGDVYTVDNSGTTGQATFGGVTYDEVTGAPSNGVREASASQTITIGATRQAFATVTKVHGTVDTKTTPALTDDTLSYNLAVKVADQIDVPSTSSAIAADLTGEKIQLKSSATAAPVEVEKVLVSDAVPQYTTAKSLNAPTGWEAVYTTSATTTKANAAEWINLGTGNVTVPAGATRVGFISSGPIAKGTTTPVMSVTVEFTNMPATGANVANIAQVFGSTNTGTFAAPVADFTKPVYDESGDGSPNNYNDNGTPGPVDPITGKPVVETGVIDPANPGTTDSGNNNTGTGPGGEGNVMAIVPASQIGILNGTSKHPEAVGPTGNNDDFTNVSVPIPASSWVLDPITGKYNPSAIDPAAVGFSNTLEATTAGNVDLLPTLPGPNETPLPNGTKVTITQGSVSKTFEIVGGIFVNAGTTTPATPLVVAVPANTKVNYGVEVDLPSTAEQLKGYGVPITATTATGATNTTVDRVYTGYLKLVKEAQVTDATGVIIQAYTDGVAPNAALPKATPGQMIQYRITYTNISDVAPVGSNSVALSAQNIRVVEDGAAGPNNWAANSTHKSGSAVDTNNGAITYDAGKSNTSPDVNVYTDLVAPNGSAPLAPQQAGSFSFTRIVK